MKKNNRKTKHSKRKKTHKKTKKLRCSPNPKNHNKFTCYDNEDLYKLRDLWNIRHPDAQIESTEVHVIWNNLNQNMRNICDKESCWLKQNFVGKMDRNKLIHAFAPVAPATWKKKPNEWLSSTEIIDVMRQYERAYKCFTFIGPSPIDYDTRKLYGQCIWPELCNFSLKELINKNKNKVGMIFNLDPHYLPGSHWVSIFVNIKKKLIFYFDSAGAPIPDQLMKLVNTITQQGNALGIHFKFDQNYPVEHQYGNTECGVYALYFIVHMLQDKINNHYLKTHILKDKFIEGFRKIYFNEEKI